MQQPNIDKTQGRQQQRWTKKRQYDNATTTFNIETTIKQPDNRSTTTHQDNHISPPYIKSIHINSNNTCTWYCHCNFCWLFIWGLTLAASRLNFEGWHLQFRLWRYAWLSSPKCWNLQDLHCIQASRRWSLQYFQCVPTPKYWIYSSFSASKPQTLEFTGSICWKEQYFPQMLESTVICALQPPNAGIDSTLATWLHSCGRGDLHFFREKTP